MEEAAKTDAPIASHGRGGAGNIGPDTTEYVDGNIVRTGAEGDHGDGAYSGGRGGAGNIGSPGLAPTQRKDAEAIPEAALRPSTEDRNYHVGRGGGGNVHAAEGVDKKKEGSLAEKLKNKLFKKKVEKSEASTETAAT